VRTPSDLPTAPKPANRRGRRWIIVAAVLVLLAGLFFRTFAVFYTDALWFSSVQLRSVWVKLFEIKAGLMLVFSAIFAVLLLVSLLVAERLAPKGPSMDAEDEFVKRYREVIGPYARWLRAAVVIVLSLIVGFIAACPFHTTMTSFRAGTGVLLDETYNGRTYRIELSIGINSRLPNTTVEPFWFSSEICAEIVVLAWMAEFTSAGPSICRSLGIS